MLKQSSKLDAANSEIDKLQRLIARLREERVNDLILSFDQVAPPSAEREEGELVQVVENDPIKREVHSDDDEDDDNASTHGQPSSPQSPSYTPSPPSLYHPTPPSSFRPTLTLPPHSVGSFAPSGTSNERRVSINRRSNCYHPYQVRGGRASSSSSRRSEAPHNPWLSNTHPQNRTRGRPERSRSWGKKERERD